MDTSGEHKEQNDKARNIVWHCSSVTQLDRIQQKNQKPVVLWFTGLSGSGKSTIANAVEVRLLRQGKHSYLLDGDNIRHGLNKDLSFSHTDRIENIRRIGEVAKLFVDSGLIVLATFISPFITDRQQVRALFPETQFLEVYIDTPLAVCEARDPKGLYQKARRGAIRNFTGIDSEYQPPLHPEAHINTEKKSIEACAEEIIEMLRQLGYLEGEK